MRLSGTAGQKLASLSLLNDAGPEVEGEHGGGVSLLLVELVGLGLPLPNREWLGLVPRDLPRGRLDVQQGRSLTQFYSVSILLFTVKDP